MEHESEKEEIKKWSGGKICVFLAGAGGDRGVGVFHH